MESLYQTTNGSTMAFVSYEDEWYIIQLIGNVSKRHFQAALQAILEDATSTEYTKVILNIRDLGTNPDVGRRWLTRQFMMPYSRQVGSLHLAIVQGGNALERYTVPWFYHITRLIGVKIGVRFFKDISTAQDWLAQIDAQDASYTHHHYTPTEERSLAKGALKVKKQGEQRTVEVGKGRFKFKVHFDPKGRYEKPQPLKNALPPLPKTEALNGVWAWLFTNKGGKR